MFTGGEHKFAVHEHMFMGREHKFTAYEYKIVKCVANFVLQEFPNEMTDGKKMVYPKLKGDFLDLDRRMQEELSLLLEFLGVFGGQVVGLAPFGATLFHLRMALEIALQSFSHVFALRNDADATRHVFMYFG